MTATWAEQAAAARRDSNREFGAADRAFDRNQTDAGHRHIREGRRLIALAEEYNRLAEAERAFTDPPAVESWHGRLA